MNLVRRHPLLRRTEKMNRYQPVADRDMAALHHGPDRHGELLPAYLCLALVDAGPRRFPHELDRLSRSAVRISPILVVLSPAGPLQMVAGFSLVQAGQFGER